jgi:hypothetical protein
MRCSANYINTQLIIHGFVVIMDSSSRQRDKQGLAMAMKSSFKHSCSSKRDEQGLAMAMRSSFKGSCLSKYSVRRLSEES